MAGRCTNYAKIAGGVARMRQSRTFDLVYAITLIAVFYSGFASAGLAILKPLIVGALIDDFKFSPREAGFVAGIEMAGIGVAAFVVAAFGGAWNRRLVILVGVTLGIVGSLIPFFSHAFDMVLVMRLLAGIGCGLIASTIFAVIGGTRDPDRTFGLYYMLTYVGAAMLVPAGSWVLAHFGAGGGYGLLALVLLIVYIAVPRIPHGFYQQRESGIHNTLPPFPLKDAVVSLSLSLVFWTGLGAVWAFVERLGVDAGLTSTTISKALTIGPLMSMAGAFTVSLLHTRHGRSLPLLVAIILAIVSVGLVGWGGTTTTFTAGVLLFSFLWPVFLAYLGGTMAALDPGGRVVAMSVTSQTIGMALGPAAAGMLAGTYGYAAIIVMGLVCFGVALMLLTLLTMRTRRVSPTTIVV